MLVGKANCPFTGGRARDHVAALRPDFGGRMQVTMSNGEVVVASRQYVPALAKLGL